MVLSKKEKRQLVKELVETLKERNTFLVTNFHGLSSKDINDLRMKLFEKGMAYKAIKKSLIARALQRANLSGFDITKAEGQIALAWGEDGVDLAKTLNQFGRAKKHEIIIAGFLEGTFLPKEKVIALSKLPSIDIMRAQLAGVLRAPIVGFMNVLNGNQKKLVLTLKAIAEAKA